MLRCSATCTKRLRSGCKSMRWFVLNDARRHRFLWRLHATDRQMNRFQYLKSLDGTVARTALRLCLQVFPSGYYRFPFLVSYRSAYSSSVREFSSGTDYLGTTRIGAASSCPQQLAVGMGRHHPSTAGISVEQTARANSSPGADGREPPEPVPVPSSLAAGCATPAVARPADPERPLPAGTEPRAQVSSQASSWHCC